MVNQSGPVDEALLRSQIRAEVESEVRLEFAERWLKERALLIEKLEKMIAAEVTKLRETR